MSSEYKSSEVKIRQYYFQVVYKVIFKHEDLEIKFNNLGILLEISTI